MPHHIVKVDRDRDAYLIWSTVVESVTGFGTRAELQTQEPAVFTDDRFKRADQTGTSANYGRKASV